MRKNCASQSGLFNSRVLLAPLSGALCLVGGLVGPPASASAPVTTSATDATALKLSSGHNVLALYRTSSEVTGHVDPGTSLPGVHVAPSDFPDAFRGLWGPDDGELGVWLSPSGFLQYSPNSVYVNSSYMTNSMLPAEAPPFEKTGSIPIEAGDHFDLVMGDVVGNAPLPGDLQRGAANGQLAWDYAASTQHLTASYSGVSGASDALFFRADVVARGGDVDARLTQMQTPPLVIDLPPGASAGTVSYIVSAIFPYTHYMTFSFRIVPNTNTAILTASVSGYIPQAREYELPSGGQMNEWHLPIIGVVTVNPAGAGQTQGVAFMRAAAGDALVNASGAGATQSLHVRAGCSVVAGGKLSPTVLEPALGASQPNEQVAPALLANAGGSSASTEDLGVPRDQAKLTREFAAAEPIGPLTTTSTELTVAGGRYSLTLDPDYRGEGILALSAVKRSADGTAISTASSVPFVLLDGQPVPLDRSHLTDLRVIPTLVVLGVELVGGGGGPPPTPTIENELRADDLSGAHVDAVYDLGQGRYAFLTFNLTKSDSFDFGHIVVTSEVRSLSGDPVQASPIQYGELPEVGPVIYDGTIRDSEFSAPLDFLGDHKSLEAGGHVILATQGSQGHDGIITVLTAPAPLTPEPVADPATSIDNQRLAYFYAPSSDFPSSFSAIITQLTNAVSGFPAPPPLGQSCTPPQVVDSTTVPDAPPALDIEEAWFDSDAVNLYASIQVADLPQAAPADTGYSWTLNWRYNDSSWHARASLDSDGKWSFDNGLADVTGETKPGPHGVMRITIPRALLDVVDGDLLRDTGAHSYVVSQGRSEEVDQAPNGANANYGSGGDYIIGPSCALPLVSVVSRKAHGSAGTFDVDLPLTGPPGIECRSGGANGDYTLVFKFANTLTSVGGASVTSGTGTVSSTMIGTDAHQYIVNLTGVTNAQYITVTLTSVIDSAGNSSSSVPSPSMGVLLGDTSANGLVNSTDVSQTQGQSGQAVTGSNFRTDVNVNGLINSTDVSIVQSKSGTGFP